MVLNSWPGPAWEAERLQAYVIAVEPLDAEIAVKAVARAVQVLKFRPTVAELREFVRIERSMSQREVAEYVKPEKPERPEWVIRWERARACGDWRAFPEQMSGMDAMARTTPENFSAYSAPNAPIFDREYWVQPDEYLE